MEADLGAPIEALFSRFDNEYQKVYPRANNGEDWEVSNYDRGNEGVMNLMEATRISSNTIYADLMLEVGPGNAADVARRLGVRTELPVVNSLVLGAGEVSVLDMASAYSTFEPSRCDSKLIDSPSALP